MLKPSLLFILSLFAATIASAQQKTYNPLKDTIVYLLKYPNTMVYKKEEADYFRVVTPPKDDQKLYNVHEIYLNGKNKLMATSTTSNLYLRFQGTVLEYFENGHKKTVENFDNGKLTGDVYKFYPNGKLYISGKYDQHEKLMLDEYADSTGKVLAEKGNGYWVKYNDDFKRVIGEGDVKDSLEDGEWHGNINDTLKYACVYNKGTVVSGQDPEPLLNPKVFSAVEIAPGYKGGIENVYRLIAQNLHYPPYARDHNIKGKVFVTFVIEKDGSLSDVKVIKKIGGGLDEEAMRVIELTAPWIPGYQNNRPVRVQYTMPINFDIGADQ